MKILHTADLHLASPLTSRLSPEKREVRLCELNDTFFFLLTVAKREGVRAVLLCGDIFDSAAVTAPEVSSFLSAIRENGAIDFFYVSGNHEKDLLRGYNLPTNLHIFGDKLETFTIENVTFTGKSTLTPDLFSDLSLPRDWINILLLHGSANGGTAGEIPLAAARGREIDYLALGHYHTYGVLPIDARGVAVYAGMPEGRGFDETGEKGCVLLDTEGGRISHRFLKTARRVLHDIPLDLSSLSEGESAERRASDLLSEIPREDLVRLSLIGEPPQWLMLPTVRLRYLFAERFFYFEVKDRTLPADAHTKEGSPLRRAFVSSVESDEGLNDEERAAVLRMGFAALEGGEIPLDHI